MPISPITPQEFEAFRCLIHRHAGIALAPEKQVMVASRLAKRLDYFGLETYGEYFALATDHNHGDEFQTMVNLLTTNETYFFREPQHFEFLVRQVLSGWRGNCFRIWSAASSSGEEAYSLAMTLAENMGMHQWQVIASDLSTRVLETAQKGVYPLDRLEHMDSALLEKYCLKGVRTQSGYFRVDNRLRSRVQFRQLNLMQPLPTEIGKFEVIFLRNVLIYFDQNTKRQVVERLTQALRPGGYFFISHAESLYRVTDRLRQIKPSIYQKP